MKLISLYFALGIISAAAAEPSSRDANDLSAAVVINAPMASVWKTVWDFKNYPEWNTTISNLRYSGNQDQPKIGDKINVRVEVNGNFEDFPKALTLTSLSKNSFCWTSTPFPGLTFTRFIVLTKISERKTEYFTYETITGFLSGVIGGKYRPLIKVGLKKEAGQLQSYLERRKP